MATRFPEDSNDEGEVPEETPKPKRQPKALEPSELRDELLSLAERDAKIKFIVNKIKKTESGRVRTNYGEVQTRATEAVN